MSVFVTHTRDVALPIHREHQEPDGAARYPDVRFWTDTDPGASAPTTD